MHILNTKILKMYNIFVYMVNNNIRNGKSIVKWLRVAPVNILCQGRVVGLFIDLGKNLSMGVDRY